MLGAGIATAQSPGVVTQLSVSANKRYLVDQHGVPFLMQGDSAQSLIVATTDAEVVQYLENRRAKGFNAIVVNLIDEHSDCEQSDTRCRQWNTEFRQHPPLNLAGEAPFTTPGDFSTPNEKYFAYADWVIRKAAEYGMQALLYPTYLGCKDCSEGWYDELLALKPEKCLAFGRYLGKRYKDFDNIIWVMGADRDPGPAQENFDLVALGVKEYDHRHLFTAHAPPEESAVDCCSLGRWLDFNTTYTYEVVQQKLLDDYNRTPTMPFVLIEATYEGEHNASEVQVRRQAYWATLCGAFGQFLGNSPLYGFEGPTIYRSKGTWQEAMDLPGSVDMVYWGRLFRSRAWYDLIPDQKHEVVTGGLGEFTGCDYLAAARTSDGSTVIAYMPTSRTITVNMGKVSGAKAIGWWFDPRTGRATAAGTFPTSGTQELSPPAQGDWGLVIDDASRKLPAPGTKDLARP
jgi:hypothetical protein